MTTSKDIAKRARQKMATVSEARERIKLKAQKEFDRAKKKACAEAKAVAIVVNVKRSNPV